MDHLETASPLPAANSAIIPSPPTPIHLRLRALFHLPPPAPSLQEPLALIKKFLATLLPTITPVISLFVANNLAYTWAGRDNTNTASAMSAMTPFKDLVSVSLLGLFAYALIPLISINQRVMCKPLFWQSCSFAFLTSLSTLIFYFFSRAILSININDTAVLDLTDNFFQTSIRHVLPWLFFVPSFWADSLAIGSANLKVYNISRIISSAAMIIMAYFTLVNTAEDQIFQNLADVFGMRDTLHTILSLGLLFWFDPQNFSFRHFQYFDPEQTTQRPWYYLDKLASLKSQLTMGLPIGYGITLELVQFYLANNLVIASIGIAALSARYVLMQVYLALRVPIIFGIQNAGMSKVSKAYGQNNYVKAVHYGDTAIYIAGAILMLASIIVLASYRQISNLAIDPNNPNNEPIFNQLGLDTWGLKMLSVFFEALGFSAYGALNGIKRAHGSNLLQLTAFIPLSIGLSYLSGVTLNYKLPGYYFGHMLAMAFFAIGMLLTWYQQSRQLLANNPTMRESAYSTATLFLENGHTDEQSVTHHAALESSV